MVNRFRGPRLRWAIIIVVALWVVYVVGANVLIRSGFLQKIAAKDPQRTKLTWDRAWTVVPGMVHVRGFSLWKHTRGTEWSLAVDKGRATINLLALPFNSLQIVTARARGVEFRLGKADTVLPRKQKTKPGMRVRFLFARADDIRTVQIGDFNLVGPLTVRGGLDTRTRGQLRIPKTRIRARSAVLNVGDEILASNLVIDGSVSIDRHVPREHRDEGLLPFLVARIGIKGEMKDLGFLDFLLKSTGAVRFGGGAGALDADIHLVRGVIEPSSRLVTEEAEYRVNYIGYEAEGTGSILGFSAADSSTGELLQFHLKDFSLSYSDDENPYIAGNDLTVSLRGDEELRVVGQRLPLDLVVDMPESVIPDMTVYNRNLKSSDALRIVSGSGRLSAHIEILERSGGGWAEADLVADDLVVDLKGKRLVGDLSTTSRIVAVDDDRTVFDPAGTRVEFRNADAFVVGGEGEARGGSDQAPADWWGVVEIPKGKITLTGQPELDVDFTLHADSAEPLFALFAKTQKKADKMDKRFNTEDLSGSGHFEMAKGHMAVTDLEVDGGKAMLRANLCILDGGMHGLIHGRYGILAVAAELKDGKESLHITSPKRWYDIHAPDFRCE